MVLAEGISFEALSTEDLCARCRQETERYHRREAYDDGFCFHVFRRAIERQDDACWEALQSIYHAQVLAWCRRSGAGLDLGAEELVSLAWEKFWKSFKAEKLAQAASTASIQRFLKACAQTAVIDLVRERRSTESLDRPAGERSEAGPTRGDLLADAGTTPEQSLTAGESRGSFWQVIARHLTSEQERSLIFLRFEMGLAPREIAARCPELFTDERDVYRVTRNLLDRLRRSPELRAWIKDEES
jgi:RNA polymerase sigma factor (sigma-70 family)